MSKLREFFEPMFEGPRDPAFKPAPEIPVEEPLDPAAAEMGADPMADPMAGGDPMMTQDVSTMAPDALNFFQKNVDSAVSKYNLQAEGFDTTGVQAFAGAMDDFAYNMYTGVQDPASRQGFEVDYQKIAADWSKDLTKLFEKILKLASHSQSI